MQVAGPQARAQRVFHGLAKGQGLAQILLDPLAPAHIAHQQGQHQRQCQGHGADQGAERIGKQPRPSLPGLHAHHQGVAGQVQQLLGAVEPLALAQLAVQGQPRAIGFGKGQGVATRQQRACELGQHITEPVQGYCVAGDAPAFGLRDAQLHQFAPLAVGLRHKVAVGVSRALKARGGAARQIQIGLILLTRHA